MDARQDTDAPDPEGHRPDGPPTDTRVTDGPTTDPSSLETVRTDLYWAWTETRQYVLLAFLIFVVSIPVGTVLWSQGFDLLAAMGAEDLGDVFPEELTATTIFVNNTRVLVLLVVGAISAGLLTGAILLFNGLFIGYFVTPVALDEGLGFVLLAILPHGIPELFALFVGAGIGFYVVKRGVDRLRGRSDVVLGKTGWRRLGVLLAAAWVVIGVAAVIEVYVTFWLLEALF